MREELDAQITRLQSAFHAEVEALVGLPWVPASGTDINGVPFSTAATRINPEGPGDQRILDRAQDLAMLLRSYAEFVGAVRVHALTPPTLTLMLASSDNEASWVLAAYADVVFETPTGFRSPDADGANGRDRANMLHREKAGLVPVASR